MIFVWAKFLLLRVG